MTEVLHAGALVPTAVGACCTLTAGGARRAVTGSAAGIMLLAMIDLTFGVLRVPSVVWAALMLVVAIAVAATTRPRARARDGAAPHRMGRLMTLHSSVGLVAMAGLVAAGMGSAAAGSDGHAHPAGTLLLPLAVAGGAGYAVASWLMAALALGAPELPGRARSVRAIELASMGAATAVMTVAALGF